MPRVISCVWVKQGQLLNIPVIPTIYRAWGSLLHSQDSLLPSSDEADSRQLEPDWDLQADYYWCHGVTLWWSGGA